MEEIGTDLTEKVRKEISTGKECRVFFDNLDFRILVNIELKNHRNSDIHWMAQYVTFDRVPSNHLDDSRPLIQSLDGFDNINYLLSSSETEKLRKDYIVLVIRVLVEFFDFMKVLESAVPCHIHHRYGTGF